MTNEERLARHEQREDMLAHACTMFWIECKQMPALGSTVSPECGYLSTVLSPMFTAEYLRNPDGWEDFKEKVRAQIELGFRTCGQVAGQ